MVTPDNGDGFLTLLLVVILLKALLSQILEGENLDYGLVVGSDDSDA